MHGRKRKDTQKTQLETEPGFLLALFILWNFTQVGNDVEVKVNTRGGAARVPKDSQKTISSGSNQT